MSYPQSPTITTLTRAYTKTMFSRKRNRMIYKKKKNKCAWCLSEDRLTFDHKHPVSLGGTDDDKNIQTLCYECNSLKSSIPNKQIKKIMRRTLEINLTRLKNNKKPIGFKWKEILIFLEEWKRASDELSPPPPYKLTGVK